MVRQLLYASNTSRDTPDTVLDDILAASRRNNAGAGVTGMLLYVEGTTAKGAVAISGRLTAGAPKEIMALLTTFYRVNSCDRGA